MAKWLQPFSFGCKSYKQSGCKGRSPIFPLMKCKTPHMNPQNILKSLLNFTAHFGEINPNMLYHCRQGLSGSEKEVLPLFSLFGGRR